MFSRLESGLQPHSRLICFWRCLDPIVCPPKLVSGNYWRQIEGVAQPTRSKRTPEPTEFEGDPDPEAPTEDYVYTEKRESKFS